MHHSHCNQFHLHILRSLTFNIRFGATSGDGLAGRLTERDERISALIAENENLQRELLQMQEQNRQLRDELQVARAAHDGLQQQYDQAVRQHSEALEENASVLNMLQRSDSLLEDSRRLYQEQQSKQMELMQRYRALQRAAAHLPLPPQLPEAYPSAAEKEDVTGAAALAFGAPIEPNNCVRGAAADVSDALDLRLSIPVSSQPAADGGGDLPPATAAAVARSAAADADADAYERELPGSTGSQPEGSDASVEHLHEAFAPPVEGANEKSVERIQRTDEIPAAVLAPLHNGAAHKGCQQDGASAIPGATLGLVRTAISLPDDPIIPRASLLTTDPINAAQFAPAMVPPCNSMAADAAPALAITGYTSHDASAAHTKPPRSFTGSCLPLPAMSAIAPKPAPVQVVHAHPPNTHAASAAVPVPTCRISAGATNAVVAPHYSTADGRSSIHLQARISDALRAISTASGPVTAAAAVVSTAAAIRLPPLRLSATGSATAAAGLNVAAAHPINTTPPPSCVAGAAGTAFAGATQHNIQRSSGFTISPRTSGQVAPFLQLSPSAAAPPVHPSLRPSHASQQHDSRSSSRSKGAAVDAESEPSAKRRRLSPPHSKRQTMQVAAPMKSGNPSMEVAPKLGESNADAKQHLEAHPSVQSACAALRINEHVAGLEVAAQNSAAGPCEGALSHQDERAAELPMPVTAAEVRERQKNENPVGAEMTSAIAADTSLPLCQAKEPSKERVPLFAAFASDTECSE